MYAVLCMYMRVRGVSSYPNSLLYYKVTIKRLTSKKKLKKKFKQVKSIIY